MMDKENILISIEKRHINNLLNGTKTIELRRRNINIPTGGKVWMYAKLPIGSICAVGIVKKVINTAPDKIWHEFGKVSGLNKMEFDEYFLNIEIGCVLLFENIHAMRSNISLNEMRSISSSFHPPQFFKYLSKNSVELIAIETNA